jgi:hypothetical protein
MLRDGLVCITWSSSFRDEAASVEAIVAQRPEPMLNGV